jgi:hypothetical protein
MIAKIAAAMMITHFAQTAGHEEIASTTTAAARINLQKHSFMISPPFSSAMSLYYEMQTPGKPDSESPRLLAWVYGAATDQLRRWNCAKFPNPMGTAGGQV